MLTDKPEVQADQGELDLVFNIFSLPPSLTSLGGSTLGDMWKAGPAFWSTDFKSFLPSV